MEIQKFDVVIIGFGKGGKTLAVYMAKRSNKVAIIERSDKMYGGTCINIGCIPTKTLVHQAKIAACGSNRTFEEQKIFYRKSIEIKNNVTSVLRKKNYDNLASNPNVTVFDGIGSFVSEDTVSVRLTSGTILLQSSHIFINIGAETVLPPIEGIKDSRFVHTSTSMLEVNELPRNLVIIGGGYIGLEFASMYSYFGSKVTVLESGDKLIPREDRDIADAVKDNMEKHGIIFRMNVLVKSVHDKENSAVVTFTEGNSNSSRPMTIEANEILVATGRRPDTSLLNLPAAGVAIDERGNIMVDNHLVTSNPSIRAIGDVKGGPQFTYVSLDDYRIIREDLFGDGNRVVSDRDPVVYSVFIDPPLARIGMSEDEAAKSRRKYSVKILAVAAIPRAKTLGESVGMLKAIVDDETNKVLGCTLFCPEASEIINIVAFVMKYGMPYTALRDFIFTHPSMSEALNDLFA